MRPARRLALVLATAFLLLGTLATVSGAQTTTTARPGDRNRRAEGPNAGSRMELVSQTLWHTGTEPFQVRLRLALVGRSDALEVAVLRHGRLRNRISFQQSLTDPPGDVQAVTRRPVSTLVPEEDGTVLVTIAPQVTVQGVYPIRVVLRERDTGDAVYDSFVTHIVYAPANPSWVPLDVAVVLPVHAPPATTPDGSLRLARDARTNLAALGPVLAAVPRVPLTLSPTPETLDALKAAADAPQGDLDALVLQQLAAGAAGRQVLASHYVPTDLSAMLAANLGWETEAQLARGRDTVAQTLGVPRPDNATRALYDQIDEGALNHLKDRQPDPVKRLIVPERYLNPTGLNIALTQPFELDGGGISGLLADGALASHFDRAADQPVLSAYHLLADLAVLFFDGPETERRGVAVLPDRAWPASPRFLNTVLTGLTVSPVLDAATTDTIFNAVRPRPGLRIGLAPRLAPPDALDERAVLDARRRGQSVRELLPNDAPALDRYERTLLASQSIGLGPLERRALRVGAAEQLDAKLAMINLPDTLSITLTARRGEIPVTIGNDTGQPVEALLVIQSDRMGFPGGERRLVKLDRPNTTERILVEARSSGLFPVTVILLSPDGRLELGRTSVKVRSTATSGVGIALSVGAAGFLAVWWVRHSRGRRSGKLVPA